MDRHAANLFQPYTGPAQRFIDNWQQTLEMSTSRHFRDHAAEPCMQVGLRSDHARQDLRLFGKDRGRRFITRSFDGQEEHNDQCPSTNDQRMTNAQAPMTKEYSMPEDEAPSAVRRWPEKPVYSALDIRISSFFGHWSLGNSSFLGHSTPAAINISLSGRGLAFSSGQGCQRTLCLKNVSGLS